eukprot:IDg15853t1
MNGDVQLAMIRHDGVFSSRTQYTVFVLLSTAHSIRYLCNAIYFSGYTILQHRPSALRERVARAQTVTMKVYPACRSEFSGICKAAHHVNQAVTTIVAYSWLVPVRPICATNSATATPCKSSATCTTCHPGRHERPPPARTTNVRDT